MSKVLYVTSFLLIIGMAGCSDSSSKIAIEKSDIRYKKPDTSNQVIEGYAVKYELWYDGKIWDFYRKDNPTHNTEKQLKSISRVLKNASNDVFVSMEETWEKMPYEESYEHYAKYVRNNMGQILDKQIRNVNGKDVLFIKSNLKVDPEPLTSAIYILTTKSGGVSVSAATTENLFDRHEKEIFDILNGLVDPER